MDVLRYLGNAGLPVLGISVNPSLCFLAADSVGGILTHHSWTATAAGPIRIADSPASPCCPYFGGEERAPAELRLEGVAPEVNMRRSDWSCWAFLDPLPAASQRRRRPTSTSTADSPAAASHSDDPAAARRHGAVAASHSRPGGVPVRPPVATARRPGAASRSGGAPTARRRGLPPARIQGRCEGRAVGSVSALACRPLGPDWFPAYEGTRLPGCRVLMFGYLVKG